MTKRYIAKPNTWYKEGTEAFLICEVTDDSGLFKGIKKVEEDDNISFIENYGIGYEFEDEELCGYDEFDIIIED